MVHLLYLYTEWQLLAHRVDEEVWRNLLDNEYIHQLGFTGYA
jgi:hypothetical protein